MTDRVSVTRVEFHGRELEEYESVKAWKNSMQPATNNSWCRQKLDLAGYCMWRDKDPDAILAERKTNRAKDAEARVEEAGVLKYRQHLWDKGLAPGSGQKALISIVSFFKHNYQSLVFATFPTLTADQFRGSKRLKKEEVQKLYQFAGDYRDKLIVVGGAETGFRLQGLQALRLGSFVALEDGSKEGVGCQKIDDLDNVMIPCRISLPKRFYTAKRKREGMTFVCKDFVKLLKEYLEQRRKLGEPINANTPIFPTYRVRLKLCANGVVILRHRDSWANVGSRVTAAATIGSQHGQMEAEVLEIRVDPLADDSIEAVFRRIRDRTEITYDTETERAASPHSLRKYLHSTLDASGVNSVMVNVIIGHSNAIAEHYSGRKNLDVEEIRHAYESAMHRIAVTEDSNGVRVKQLEKEQKRFQFETTEAIAQLLQNQQALFDILTMKGADPIRIEQLRKLGGQSFELLQRIKLQQTQTIGINDP